MSRFAHKKTSSFETDAQDAYEHGYSYPTTSYAHISQPGLSEGVVREISHIKEEPDWMLAKRLEALKIFEAKPMQPWGPDLSAINFDEIHYYLRPADSAGKTLADIPAEVRATYERLGIAKAEQEALAGIKFQYDSEVVYGSLKDVYAKDGVIFLSMDEGLRQYPDLVKEYFSKVIPSGDNKFAALNTAAWSGGSFVYVPPGVHVKMPLQTYFRINAENAGQFERTLIIVGEGAKVHYIEGCFVAGTSVLTDRGVIQIENVEPGDEVLTHEGRYRSVKNTQLRSYSGNLHTLTVVGQPHEKITATDEHPFLVVKRILPNERNHVWEPNWLPIKQIQKGDYLAIPISQVYEVNDEINYLIPIGLGGHGWVGEELVIPCSEELFRLIGYYLAEGSISGGYYLNFSFSELERSYIDDVKDLITKVFRVTSFSESAQPKNHGVSVVVRSVRLCRFFEQFGTHSSEKNVPAWVMNESIEKQKQLILGWFRGDGNYYRKNNKSGFKEVFRICTVSNTLANQGRMILARIGIASSLNANRRVKRQTMFTIIVGGEYMIAFGELVDRPVQLKMWGRKHATFFHLDSKYMYVPVKKVEISEVLSTSVYNFAVEEDESYVVGGVAVHNCTAPSFSTGSLHSAVVEIFVKKGARCQYTTVQNWYKNVYNLVTKRAWVEAEAEMVWTDFNMGSKITMKYPSFILAGAGAKGETLSMALAGAGQHQDTGSKAIHLAPHTSSTILSKSISKDGGRTSYRGTVNVGPLAKGSKNTVICDALLLDSRSRSDTYPTDKVFNSDVEVQHEATVSKIGDDQLFYLMSRGVTEEDARKLIVNGFVEDLVRKLPLEYAVEMNRLIDHEMEGSIG